jgi:2-dehydropantoate 2-reductase
MAAQRFSNVYGVFVWCPADYLTPGHVRVWCSPRSGILHIGRYPSGSDATAGDVAAAFRGATFYAEAKPDIMRWKYRKLLSNLGNAVDALCGTAARGSGIAQRARAEGIACLKAAGISFITDDEEDAARLEREVHPRTIAGEERRGGSSWQSLERRLGTIETDYLNGEIVRLGQEHGVPTPVNALLQYLSQRVARERRPPGSVNPDKILIALDLRQNPLQ